MSGAICWLHCRIECRAFGGREVGEEVEVSVGRVLSWHIPRVSRQVLELFYCMQNRYVDERDTWTMIVNAGRSILCIVVESR